MKVEITKKDALERLIRAGIISLLLGHDDLATHLIASSSSKVAMDLCEKKAKGLNILKIYVKPEYHSDFFRVVRKNYNFLKHADHDHDGVIDISAIRVTNCFEIMLAIQHYMLVYGIFERWEYHVFLSYMLMKHPTWINTESFSASQIEALRRMEKMRGDQDVDEFFRKQLVDMLEYAEEIREILPGFGL